MKNFQLKHGQRDGIILKTFSLESFIKLLP